MNDWALLLTGAGAVLTGAAQLVTALRKRGTPRPRQKRRKKPTDDEGDDADGSCTD